MSVIDGNTCNATITTSCGQAPPTVPAGANPSGVAVNPNDGTAYAVDNGGATATFLRFVVPRRPAGVTATARHRGAMLAWGRVYSGGLPVIYHVTPSPACSGCTGLTTPSTSGVPATTVGGLARGVTYTFTITATDAAGTGPASVRSNPITIPPAG
jgi:hypothetical protein